jgi:hypothetical protein
MERGVEVYVPFGLYVYIKLTMCLAPSRPSKHPGRQNAHPQSPLLRPTDITPPTSLTGSSMLHAARKIGTTTNVKPVGINLVEKIQPLSFVLQPPEEQTDNWDDDFEEGISLTKLQGRHLLGMAHKNISILELALERTNVEDDKPDVEDNAQTIRPNRSPGLKVVPLSQPPSSNIIPIVEDYSDLAEEDEQQLQVKVADFKVDRKSYIMLRFVLTSSQQVKNSVRRGLFHPDDIKTVGLNASPAPMSAPLPGLQRKSSRQSINLISASSASPFNPSPAQALVTHSRSASLAGPVGNGGSFGRAEARRLQNQTEFGKYTEDDDENYEDVFGKVNGTG